MIYGIPKRTKKDTKALKVYEVLNKLGALCESSVAPL